MHSRSAYRTAFRAIVTKLLLIILGCLSSLVIATAVLMLFPKAIFGTTSYYERRFASQSLEVVFRSSDGDLFAALPGSIRPPREDLILQNFTLSWDSDGFRQPATSAPAYPIAVFGDSFTEGFNVPAPYSDRLAHLLNVPVRNFGYRAYGPVEVAQAAREFAAAEPRTWLLYGYFSGNDLGDAVRPPKLDTTSPVALWRALFDRLNPPVTDPYKLPPKDQYDFPMPVIIGGSYYELAFLWYYWWWQLAPAEGFATSSNFATFATALDAVDADLPAETCKALVFIPTKEQLYYRYIYQTERQWIRSAGHKLVLAEENMIRMIPQVILEEEEADFIAALYGQYHAVKTLIESKPGWRFIDLLPAFEAAAADGQLLYYPYDSHWNQAGHDLAAQVIAAAMQAAADCPIRMNGTLTIK